MWGFVGAVLVAVFTVMNVLSQPASPHPEGGRLLLDVVWLGIVYGTLDALLLSVVPIDAVWRAFSSVPWTRGVAGKLAIGMVALVASLVATTAYHLGYPEFRNARVAAPIVGTATLGLAYLLTSNPLASILGHIAMHVAAVLHGPATTVQLPPHY